MNESKPYSVLNVAEIDPIPAAGILWKPLRQPLGIDAFGINAYSAAAAGDHVIESHTEEALGHQEVYVVIAGHATFSSGDDELDGPNGMVVFVRDPSVRRGATAVVSGKEDCRVGEERHRSRRNPRPARLARVVDRRGVMPAGRPGERLKPDPPAGVPHWSPSGSPGTGRGRPPSGSREASRKHTPG